jgi:tetratricopeptide (TPR) repeat protein
MIHKNHPQNLTVQEPYPQQSTAPDATKKDSHDPTDTAICMSTGKVADESTASQLTAVPNAQLQESLSELSKRITEWKVKSETPKQETVVRELSEVELPQVPVSTAQGASITVAQSASESRNRLDEALERVEELKHQKLFDEAKQELEKVMVASGMNAEQSQRVRCLEAEFLVLSGDLKGAEEVYDSILATNPKYPRALCGKGALTAERQEWSDAKRLFDEALTAQPGYDVALAGLGLCAMVGNNEQGAFELFMQAARKNPENRRAMFGVMQLGYPLQRFTEIEEMLNAYLDLHPASIDMLYSLAGVLFRQGRVSEARMEVEKILLFEPQNELALELQKIIDDKQGVAGTVM